MNVKDVISNTNGKFFTVTFIKANGELRKLNGRTGVIKHLKGGNSTTAHKANLVTVWDAQIKAYRSVNVDNVLSIHANGKQYMF